MSNIQKKVVQRITIIERQIIEQRIPTQNYQKDLPIMDETAYTQGYDQFQDQQKVYRDYKVSGGNMLQDKQENIRNQSQHAKQQQPNVFDYVGERNQQRTAQQQRKMRNLAYQDLGHGSLQDNYRSVHHQNQITNTYQPSNDIIYNQPETFNNRDQKITGNQQFYLKQSPKQRIVKQKYDYFDPISGVEQKAKIQIKQQKPTQRIINKNTFSSTSSNEDLQRNSRFNNINMNYNNNNNNMEIIDRNQQPIVSGFNNDTIQTTTTNTFDNRDNMDMNMNKNIGTITKNSNYLDNNNKVTGTKKFYMKQTPKQTVIKNKSNLVDPIYGTSQKYQVKTQTKNKQFVQRQRSLSRSSSSDNQVIQEKYQPNYDRHIVANNSQNDYIESKPVINENLLELSQDLSTRDNYKGDIQENQQIYMKRTPNKLVAEQKLETYDPVTGQSEKIQIKTKSKRNSGSSRSSSSDREGRDHREGKLDKLQRKVENAKDRVLGQVPAQRISSNYVDTDAYAREKGMIKTTENSIKTKEKLDYVDPITGKEQKATIKTKVRGADIAEGKSKKTYDYKVQDTVEGPKKVVKQKHRIGGVMKNIKNKIETKIDHILNR